MYVQHGETGGGWHCFFLISRGEFIPCIKPHASSIDTDSEMKPSPRYAVTHGRTAQRILARDLQER